MTIPDTDTCTGLAPLIGVQVWIINQLLGLKKEVAQLQGKPKPSRRRSFISLFLLAAGPWLGFLILSSGCAILHMP